MAKELGWRELLLIGGALKAGLFQALVNKECSANELADNLNYSPRAVEIVLEALKSSGYLKRSHSHYRLTKKSINLFINKESDEYSVGSVMHSLRLINNWLKLDEAIITGKSQSSARSPEELSFFIEAMNEGAAKKAQEVALKVISAKKDARNLLDLGGGPGSYAKEFANRGLEVTLVDTQAVIGLVRQELSKHRNIKIVSGDFNQQLPSGKYDIVLLANITHIYKPDKNIALFKRAKDSLSNGGILAIVDLVRGISSDADLFAVNMLVNTAGGGTWTKNQYNRWLMEAGLKLSSFHKIKNGSNALMIAR